MISSATHHLSPAEKLGLGSLALAGVTAFASPALSVAILIFFLICCGVAPFLPTVGFFLPIISQGNKNKTTIALSFDDGPSPGSTPYILHLLAQNNITATFFIIGKKAAQHPELIKEILENGHSIGNHSWSHDNLLMFKNSDNLARDLRKTQQILAEFGIRPLAFRPPVGITGPRLGKVMEELDMYTVNFSCRAFDRGNRRVRGFAQRILDRVKGGDILLLHDSSPFQDEQKEMWQNELAHLLSRLDTRFQVVPLETLTGRPVMEQTTGKKSGHLSA